MIRMTLRKSLLRPLLSVSVRVVHHLQQDVEDVRVRLLDLVEQHDAVRVLVDRVGELAALIEADVARRRADQPRHRVLLHVLGHVEADELDAEHGRELLARARSCRRRSGRRTGSCRSACRGLPRPARDSLIAVASCSIASSWPKITRLSSRSRSASALLVGGRHAARRDPRDLRDDLLDLGGR